MEVNTLLPSRVTENKAHEGTPGKLLIENFNAMKTDRKVGSTGASWSGRAFISVAMLAAILLSGAGDHRVAVAAPRWLHASKGTIESAAVPRYCETDEDCNDGNACTEDVCDNHECVNTAIPGCVPCDSTPICPPLDVVFIMDTSGSMADEGVALCSGIAQVVDDLAGLGVSVSTHFLGITETPGAPFFECLTDDVATMLGGTVPGSPDPCGFPDAFSAHESWGPATAIVAERYPWNATAVRVIVPISDEGPCNGSFLDGCNDPGDDRDSISNAIAIANANNVNVSPITGTSADDCVITLATALAEGTGGVTFHSQDPDADLAAAIYQILLAECDPAPCDDGDPCTLDDLCIDGVCVGDSPGDLMIACREDADCPEEWFCCDTPEEYCGDMSGYCDCRTSLCVEFDRVCYESGEPIDARIVMGAGPVVVTGGQFLMSYDPTCLVFRSIGPCTPDSIFNTVIDWWVDEPAGRIWYAVLGYDPNSHEVEGTVGPYDIACLEFVKLGDCNPCNVCFLDDNPYNTVLTDEQGRRVSIENCVCSEDVLLDTDIELNCPASVTTDPDPGGLWSIVTWEPTAGSSNCGRILDLACTGSHDSGISVSDLAANGGRFPSGTSTFQCTATDPTCESSATCEWTVHVSEYHNVEIDVQLSRPIIGDPLERCIEFEFYTDDCSQLPEVVRQTVTFGWPWYFPGEGQVGPLRIPAANYDCVRARDPKHTLFSVADMQIDGDRWVAEFFGNPATDGNWLVNGNLDSSAIIDVIDMAVVHSQLGMHLDPNTACGLEGEHADINGDGLVDAADEAIVLSNFLETDKEACCPDENIVAAAGEPAITEISVKELRQRGLGHLGVADFNQDGLLNLEDGAAQAASSSAKRRVSSPR